MKPGSIPASRAAQAALEDHILLDYVLIIDDTDDFITEIRTIIRERSPRAEIP